MIWDSLEDFLFSGSLQAIFVGILKIFDIVIFLTLFEDSKFLIKDFLEVLEIKLGFLFFKLFDHCQSECVFIIIFQFPYSCSFIELLKLFFKGVLIWQFNFFL